MRPTFLRSECAAMPPTSVAKSRGAIIVLISRRKIAPIGCSLTAVWGQSYPMAAPATIATKIQTASDRLYKA